jgi:hypothetical protein
MKTKDRPLGARNADIVERVGISPRTVTRWRQAPPKPIARLLETRDGRRLLRSWIAEAERAEPQEAPAAA